MTPLDANIRNPVRKEVYNVCRKSTAIYEP